MCGIAGWVDYDEDLFEKDEILERMQSSLRRRGPDANGIFKSHQACIIHSRLSVVDIENGAQPMTMFKDGVRYVLTYNGELYNTNELRVELEALGYEFQGHSDTQVLLAAYCEWKALCLEKLNGIYAFAVYNEQEKSLFLARDRIGVKPLFYYQYKNGIIFGSEMKALLANPIVEPKIDQEGLYEIFLMGPGRTPGHGVFHDVKELQPGQCAHFSQQGMTVKTYWSLKASEHTESFEQTTEKVRYLIQDAIIRQLVSDVPLCCFLSGGLDSSIITKIAAEKYKEEGKRLSTFSVDYVDNARHFRKSVFQPDSDNAYIQLMSEHSGSKHREVILSNHHLAEALFEAVQARDLPGMADIDSSLLLFCREIKRNYTVAISGECADEIFGGYPWYHDQEILFEDNFPWSRSLALRQSVVSPDVLDDHCSQYVRARYEQTISATDKLPSESAHASRMREMFMLNFQWFMQTLLDRKDRMSMYSGLEVRVPFCDHRLAEYAYNMPWEFKSYQGREKGIVREAMRGILPEKILWRKKSPYPKTHNPQYMRLVKNGIEGLLSDKSAMLTQLVNRRAIEEIAENPQGLARPWYGQLMGGPQVLAYLLQVDFWLRHYKVEII